MGPKPIPPHPTMSRLVKGPQRLLRRRTPATTECSEPIVCYMERKKGFEPPALSLARRSGYAVWHTETHPERDTINYRV